MKKTEEKRRKKKKVKTVQNKINKTKHHNDTYTQYSIKHIQNKQNNMKRVL